jgi:hypothetical protein
MPRGRKPGYRHDEETKRRIAEGNKAFHERVRQMKELAPEETPVTKRVTAALRGELGEVTACDHLQEGELAWIWLDSPTALLCRACAGGALAVRVRVDEGLCDLGCGRPAATLVVVPHPFPTPRVLVHGQACEQCAFSERQRAERARTRARAIQAELGLGQT